MPNQTLRTKFSSIHGSSSPILLKSVPCQLNSSRLGVHTKASSSGRLQAAIQGRPVRPAEDHPDIAVAADLDPFVGPSASAAAAAAAEQRQVRHTRLALRLPAVAVVRRRQSFGSSCWAIAMSVS